MNSKLLNLALAATLAIPTVSQARSIARPYYHNQLPAELVSFPSCKALEEHVNKQVAKQNEFYRRDAFGVAGAAKRKGLMSANNMLQQAPPPAAPGAKAELAESFAADSLAKEAEGAKTVVGTNNQVEKVDEADFVKFNGKNIYQLYNGTLRILKAWPANEMNQLASMAISGNPQELLINEQNAVVLANDGSTLTASVIDIRQPANPRLMTEFKIPGHYKTARLIGDTLRIVNQDYNSIQNYWREMPMSEQGSGWFQEPVKRTLEIQPTIQTVGLTQRTLDVVKDCSHVVVPKDVSPGPLSRLISIDLKAKKYDETLAFVQADTVYASERAIYLAHGGYTYNNQNSMAMQQTAIHKFGLRPGKTAEYQASGMINGHLINQFAMDEHKDNLRVATNGSEFQGWGWNRNFQQVSRIEVLAPKGKNLKSIGRTGDMGKGERLYSVRFNGDKGYVVTFRQVDPLYTVELSDPSNPRVIGELKVPGFSTYIHMLNDKHLLTIGQDADENTGRVRGLKLSVFDVSNFKKPREVKSLIFKSNATSEASYEHKAFSFYCEKGILAIPAQQAGVRSALLLFKVTTSDIKPAGELAMTDMTSGSQGVRRSFFADNIVYAIGVSGVRAANLDHPQTPLATVEFDKSNIAESSGW